MADKNSGDYEALANEIMHGKGLPKQPRQLVIESSIDATIIRFQRARGSEWERGIAVLANAGASNVAHIIDMNLQIVPVPVWEYQLVQHEGTMTCIQIVGF